MQLVVGRVMKVKERAGEKDGKPWHLVAVAIQDGMYPLWLTLAKGLPAPTVGVKIAYEAFASIDTYLGKTRLRWTALRNLPLAAQLIELDDVAE